MSVSIDYVHELVTILERLRASDGCPWDREQTHESLKRYLIEECGELLDALDDGDDTAIVDELGDVLLQIVFHCQIGSEDGRFSLQDAARAECEKMWRRHPHVFAGLVNAILHHRPERISGLPMGDNDNAVRTRCFLSDSGAGKSGHHQKDQQDSHQAFHQTNPP